MFSGRVYIIHISPGGRSRSNAGLGWTLRKSRECVCVCEPVDMSFSRGRNGSVWALPLKGVELQSESFVSDLSLLINAF